ncbi:MAG: metal-dependent hydrolase [Planctomycetota bacterium]
MSVTVRFLGHAAFEIRSGDHTVLIDPFLTGNPVAEAAGLKAADLSPTHIVLTHGHEDHVGDTVEIGKRTQAVIHASFELCNILQAEPGIENIEPGNPGGRVDTPFGFVAFTIAFHSSSYGGAYTGQPMGAVINIGGKTIYHAGDTALFSDMKLIGELYRPHLAILPVGDRFTMGPEHASIAADWIGAETVVPCHFGTWPLLRSDISAFRPQAAVVKQLQPNELHHLTDKAHPDGATSHPI